MSVQFVSTRLEVPNGFGTKKLIETINSGRDIVRADIAVKGFGFDFDGTHPLGIIQVFSKVSLQRPLIFVEVECNYLDGGKHNYTGFVDVLVIFEDTAPQ